MMYLMTHYDYYGEEVEKIVSDNLMKLVDSIPKRPGDVLSMGENSAIAVTVVGQYIVEEVTQI